MSLNPENVKIVFFLVNVNVRVISVFIALDSDLKSTSKTGRGRVSQAWWAQGECAGHSLGRLDLRQRTVVSLPFYSVVENLQKNSGQFDTIQPPERRRLTYRHHAKVESTVKYLL